MKYEVGDKIKIIRTTEGCYGAEGKIGTVTNEPSINGLCDDKDGFNVDCGCGHIWRIGFESECELLDELTAEEAIRLKIEMCEEMSCSDCGMGKSNNNMGISCNEFQKKHPERAAKVLKQWKKDHEKKEIETEIVDLIKVMKEVCDDETCIYAYEIDMSKEDANEKMKELVKKYCEKYGNKIYAKCERVCRVKS
jgi:hypothetical protein|nr:MAG TPA: hypothetical protein [Caudoviricetes sp.]